MMYCLKCGKESKWEFCRQCKEKKHKASALLSQNKKKMIKLLNSDWTNAKWFDKFINYANNILKYWKIYMEYKNIKEYKLLKIISKATTFASLLIAIRSGLSILIIRL